MRISLMKQLSDAFGEEPFTASMASDAIGKEAQYIQRQMCPHIKKKRIKRLGKSEDGFMQYAVTRKWFAENAPEKVEKKSKKVDIKTVKTKEKEIRVLDKPIELNKANLIYFYNDVGCSVPEIARLAKKSKDHVYKVMKDKGIKTRSSSDTAQIKRTRTVKFKLKANPTIPTKTSTKTSNSLTRLEAVERIFGTKRFNEWKDQALNDAAVELLRRLISGL